MYYQPQFQISPPPYNPLELDHAGPLPQYRQPAGGLALVDRDMKSMYHAYEAAPTRPEQSLERQTGRKGQQLPQHAQEPDHQLDPLDQELQAETQFDDKRHAWHAQEYEQQEDLALDENLSWIPRGKGLEVRNDVELSTPVVIPQTAPGIKNPFSRAWSPILSDHGVRREDFLQFMDHLNVCKAASPPLQLLSLAGTIVGFTPVPFAWAIGLGTNALSIAGMIAVARIRITRYLGRVNKEYFHPRGLHAGVAKQKTLPNIVHQPPEAPLLAPLPPSASKDSFPTLRERRLQALGNGIAALRFEDFSAVSTESNPLDKVSAKMNARSAGKAEKKIFEEAVKQQKEDAKASSKNVKEQSKIERKMQKASRKGHSSKLGELEAERFKVDAKYQKEHGKGKGKDVKAAKKFLFVVIQSLEAAKATAADGQ